MQYPTSPQLRLSTVNQLTACSRVTGLAEWLNQQV